MTEEVSSTTTSSPTEEPVEVGFVNVGNENSETTTTDTPVATPSENSENVQPETLVTKRTTSTPPERIVIDPTPSAASEKPVTEPAPLTPTSAQRTFAPLNIPLSRRRETLTILVWFLSPWFCLYLSLILLRCNNWYIVGAFVLYLTWMMFLQKYPREGGYRQQWLRRFVWWKWFASKQSIFFIPA